MNIRHRQKIEQLYMRLYPNLFAYARSILDSNPLAEEAVQDTFQIACQKHWELCNSTNPEGWLFQTLRNVLRNTIRTRQSARRILLTYCALNAETIDVCENQTSLEVMFNDIADTDEFQLLKESALDGLTHLEMAQKRNITVAACRKRLQRAKEYLQRRLLEDEK